MNFPFPIRPTVIFDMRQTPPLRTTEGDVRSRAEAETGGRPPKGHLPDEFLEEFGFKRVQADPRPHLELGEVANLNSFLTGDEEAGWRLEWVVSASPRPTHEQINAERDRRGLLNFTWNGVEFQGDADSREKIAGLVSAAHMFLTLQQGSPTETKWLDGVNDFKFTAADDTEHVLTAPQLIQMGMTLAERVNHLHTKAKEIKAMEPIPYNFDHASYWTEE